MFGDVRGAFEGHALEERAGAVALRPQGAAPRSCSRTCQRRLGRPGRMRHAPRPCPSVRFLGAVSSVVTAGTAPRHPRSHSGPLSRRRRRRPGRRCSVCPSLSTDRDGDTAEGGPGRGGTAGSPPDSLDRGGPQNGREETTRRRRGGKWGDDRTFGNCAYGAAGPND